ncbi:CMD-domain-containing protein [Aspergillus pseudoustus]|uniref:CMD-domain-containing protein n=1 Tax=Aspergillus pseudoustus TaxID=1810923 RepID=A0ABR4ITK6_9EURO
MSYTPSPEKIQLGQQMSRDFLGEAVITDLQKSRSKTDIFARTSQEYIAEVCFASYARPGLKFRERSLLNIGMLIALGRGPELRIHLKAAANNGLTEEEICEACRHAMVYCGVPAGRDALLTASEVFEDLKQAKST